MSEEAEWWDVKALAAYFNKSKWVIYRLKRLHPEKLPPRGEKLLWNPAVVRNWAMTVDPAVVFAPGRPGPKRRKGMADGG